MDDNGFIPQQTITPGNGGFPVGTRTLLDPVTLKEVGVQNGFVPPDLYSLWGYLDGPLLLYTFANESLKRVQDYLKDNKVPTPKNVNNKIVFDEKNLIKLNFYVEGAHRVIGHPGDGKLSDSELIKRYGRAFSQWNTYENAPGKSAKPGSSNHGYWTAIDTYQSTDGITRNQTIIRSNSKWKGSQDQFQAWFQKYGPAWGWEAVLMPEYGATSQLEPWHFQYNYNLDPIVQEKKTKAQLQPFFAERAKELGIPTTPPQGTIIPYKNPSALNSATGISQNVQETLNSITKSVTNFFK